MPANVKRPILALRMRLNSDSNFTLQGSGFAVGQDVVIEFPDEGLTWKGFVQVVSRSKENCEVRVTQTNRLKRTFRRDTPGASVTITVDSAGGGAAKTISVDLYDE